MSDRPSRPLILIALVGALAAAGCSKPNDADQMAASNSAAPLPALPATLPLATGPANPPRYAPAVAALPAARPIHAVRLVNPNDGYAYADDAYAFSHALGDAPPDYGFDYGGTEPWVWQGYDNSRVFVEPVSDGYRYYYYRPNADEPYFVRDPDYGYGYDNGALAVIYGAGGALLPYDEYGPRLGYASRYLSRGEELYRASRANERRAVIAANWAAREDAIAASRDRWAAAAAQQAGWQAYRARVADQQARHWAQEAGRRDADAQRFARWRDEDFRGAPPPRAIPAAWQQAPWAQDQARYRPAAIDRVPAQYGPAPAAQYGPAPAAQPQPVAQRLAEVGGVGLAAGAAGYAAHRFVEGRQQVPVPPQVATGRGPGGFAPGRREGERGFGPQPAIGRGPGGFAPGARALGTQQDAARAAGLRQERVPHAPQSDARAGQPPADRAAQAARPPRGGVAERQPAVARVDRAAAEPVHIHRGGGAPGADGGTPQRGAEGAQRFALASDASHAPIDRGAPREAQRPQAPVRQESPRPAAPPMQQAAPAMPRNAPPPHAAAPAPHPQGGGGAPHHGGEHH